MFRILLAATAISMAAMFNAPANAGDQTMPRTISLTGHGEARVVPDLAIVSIGVLSQSATAAQALAANSTAMQAIFDEIGRAHV